MRIPERKKPQPEKKRRKLRTKARRNPRRRLRTAGLLHLRLRLRVIRFLRSRIYQKQSLRGRGKRRSNVIMRILYTHV